MGKIDDMRRQREQQFAEAEQRQAKAAKAKPVEPVAPPVRAPAIVAAEPAPERAPSTSKKTSKSGAAIDEQGKCPDCKKMKPLANGLLASHQKGFGKACPGSKKKPL
ncbi:MAG TPA: hypothetical protein VLT33_11175 [Labilithrix sp.]|nr:hypothetical protein [Labilithrix sp.]